MTKPLSVSKANLKRAIAAAQEMGLRVTGIRPDGTILLGETATGTLSAEAAVTHNTEPQADEIWGNLKA